MYYAIVINVDAAMAIQDIIEIHPVIEPAPISALTSYTMGAGLSELTGRKRQSAANLGRCEECHPDVLPARAGHGRAHLGQSAGDEDVDQKHENQSIHCMRRQTISHLC